MMTGRPRQRATYNEKVQHLAMRIFTIGVRIGRITGDYGPGVAYHHSRQDELAALHRLRDLLKMRLSRMRKPSRPA